MKNNVSAFTRIAILSIFCSMAIKLSLSPAIASIAAAFPALSLTMIMLVISLPTLTSVPGCLLAGPVANKLKYKNLLILGLTTVIIAGVAPYFITDNFSLMLVCRAVMGFGIGLVFPVGNMLVIAFFDGEMRAKMLGLGNVLANAGAMVFVTVGGLLATTRWNNVFLVHLVLVIILILILFLPEPAKDEISQEANSAVKPKMPGIAWLYIFGLGLCMVFIFPIMLYMSSIIEANNLGTAAEAGYVISSFTVAGMVGGLAFAKLFSKFGTKIFAFSTCLLAIGMSLLVIGNTIIFMYIGCIICGFGFIQIMSAVFWGIGSDVPPALVPSVAGFATASMNIFNFTSPYVHTFLSRLVGMSGNLKAPFFFAIFFFVASTVVFLFSAKKKVFYQDKFIPPIH